MRRLWLALLVLASCAPKQAPGPSAQVSSEKKGSSYTMKLEYPFIAGASAALNNRLAEAALIHLEHVEDDPIPFDEFAKNIAAESAGQKWVFESIMTVAHQSPSILTTLCKTLTDTGAAEPNIFHYYEVYDLATGKRLALHDLLEDGKLPAIRALAKVTGDFPNEPEIGLLKHHAVFRPDPDARTVLDAQIPYDLLNGVLKPQYLP